MRIKILLLSIVGVTSMAACSSPDFSNLNPVYNSNAENVSNDNTELAKKLQTKIMTYYPGSKVKVDANDFNVLILGEVKSIDIKNQATTMAKSQSGVKQVWNYLTINQKPVLKVNDKLLVKAVSRISMEKDILPSNVTVDAVGSNVYVMGTNIGNFTYLDHAIRGIGMIDGVDKVYNLTIMSKDDYRSEEEPSI